METYMTNCFEIENLTFAYAGHDGNALSGVSLTVARGEFVALCGPSGSGKTTLLRQLKTALAPHGARSGAILFEGEPLDSVNLRNQSAGIGFVQQRPDAQIVTDKVWHELAFGLESLGYDTAVIRRKVAEMASFFGIEAWFYKDARELSGGQKQLLNLASIMAMSPSALILDEPASQLDPIAASDFLATVGRINRELGTTVIMTEHRLEEVFPLCTRAVVMDGGSVIADGEPREVGTLLKERGHSMFLSMPTPMRVYAASPASVELPCPVTVRDGRSWLETYAGLHGLRSLPPDTMTAKRDNEPAVPASAELDEVWFRYGKDLPDVLRGLSVKVYPGELLAILGGNGTGKTTMLSVISGLNKPHRGKVRISGGALGTLPQDPQSVFVKSTVYEDLAEVFAANVSKEERAQKIDSVSRLCHIASLLDRHPYDLSGGEQQRAALAMVLLTEPKILLLDEPTKGLDSEFKAELAGILEELLRTGVTVIAVSHDIEFCARYAHRCALFFDGSIVTEDTPRPFFSGNSFYTTAANRMARHLVPGAVTAEDLIAVCGGAASEEPSLRSALASEGIRSVTVPPPFQRRPTSLGSALGSDGERAGSSDSRRLSKRMVAAMVMILAAIPLTILAGIYLLDDRKYYFTSLLIVLEAMLPFVLVFEGRKPQARELIIISVMCAIGVAGRAAFFMLPQFKPVTALVIIAGVAFGGEAGFLVGAVTAFVSNFFFGQGPWTPWQMFAFGIIGFLSGVLFRKGLLSRSRTALCIFGALAVLLIYGGIVNPASILMFQATPTLSAILTSYMVALPFDLLHAASTAVFLWLLSKPMLEKLDRIKIKYGLIDPS